MTVNLGAMKSTIIKMNIHYRSAFIALLLIAWHSLTLVIPPLYLPSPVVVVSTVIRYFISGEFLYHFRFTIVRVLLGLAISFLISLAIGIPMGLKPTVERLFDFGIIIGLTIPAVVWALLSLMWFGISELMPIFAIVATILPMICVNIWQGTKAIDKDIVEMANSFLANRRIMLMDVILPQLIPYCLAAIRYGLGLAWKVVVLAEMFGVSNGIGFMINTAYWNFSIIDLLAWIISFIAVMSMIEYVAFRPIERYLTRWRVEIAV